LRKEDIRLEIGLLQATAISLAAYLAVSVWPLGVGYFTLYRPLIGGTIVGLILGDVQGGMAFGAALNAVYLGFVSTGGSLPSDLVTAGYIGAALALTSGLSVDAALSTLGIPLGILGSFLWLGRMTLGSGLAHWADARAEQGDAAGVAAINLWAGQGLLFLFYTVPTFLAVYYGQRGVDQLLSLIPSALIQALSVVGGMLPAVGIGLLLRTIGKPRLIPYFVIGFILAVYLALPVLVVALLGAAAAWLAAGDVTAHAPDPVPERQARDAAASEDHRVPPSVLWGSWWRWVMFLHASYNFERLQGLGFAHAMKPAIEHLYPGRRERAAALQRHVTFFNSEPQFGAVVPAAVIALEEQRAAGADLSDEAINAVKSGLMGPLAGVGDSLVQGLVTPLLLSMGISLARRGNLAGPILYAVSISAAVLGSSYLFWSAGYRWGKAAVSQILASGWVQALTQGAAVVGMMALGALTPAVVQFSTPATIVVGQASISLQQDVLDAILRGLPALSLTLLAWWLLSRRVSSLRAIGVLFVVGVDLAYLGLAGQDAPPLFTRAWVDMLLGGRPATFFSALAHLLPPFVATGAAGIAWAWRKGRGEREL
jgi:PTS system mannose-specific IID component